MEIHHIQQDAAAAEIMWGESSVLKIRWSGTGTPDLVRAVHSAVSDVKKDNDDFVFYCDTLDVEIGPEPRIVIAGVSFLTFLKKIGMSRMVVVSENVSVHALTWILGLRSNIDFTIAATRDEADNKIWGSSGILLETVAESEE